MRNFYQFLVEDIIDPKRDPKKNPHERIPSDDDDYDSQAIQDLEDMNDDDFHPTGGNKLGLNTQYPLAKASGKMRGFQVKTPRQMFRKQDSLDDGLSNSDLLITLTNKSKAGERLTSREIDALLRLLNKQDAKLKNQFAAGRSRIDNMIEKF